MVPYFQTHKIATRLTPVASNPLDVDQLFLAKLNFARKRPERLICVLIFVPQDMWINRLNPPVRILFVTSLPFTLVISLTIIYNQLWSTSSRWFSINYLHQPSIKNKQHIPSGYPLVIKHSHIAQMIIPPLQMFFFASFRNYRYHQPTIFRTIHHSNIFKAPAMGWGIFQRIFQQIFQRNWRIFDGKRWPGLHQHLRRRRALDLLPRHHAAGSAGALTGKGESSCKNDRTPLFHDRYITWLWVDQ